MDFVFWLVVVTLLIVAGFFWLQSVRKRNMEQISESVTREAAQAAVALLDVSSRKDINRDLAKGDVMGAVQKYRAVTGASVKECVIAVRSMDAYPQVESPEDSSFGEVEFPALDPKADASEGEAPVADIAEDPQLPAGAPDSIPEPGIESEAGQRSENDEIQAQLPAEDAWVVPTEWNEQFGSDQAPSSTHFKLAFELEGEQREFSSEKLPPSEYDQLFSMLRDSDTTGAAEILHRHTGLPAEDLEQMIANSPMSGAQGNGDVADFRFEGQGPDGPVHFDAADLPEAERADLFDAISRTDLERMSEIIVQHTSLPQDIVQNMLRSFGKRDE